MSISVLRPNLHLQAPLLTVALGTPNFEDREGTFVPVTLTNAGLGSALNAQIISVAVMVLTGSGIKILSRLPSTPALLGPRMSTRWVLAFTPPFGPTTVSLTFQLSARSPSGLHYSATQAIKLSL
jgi:hypothetical protein